MNVLLIGPPGSGKGTQGERLSQRLGVEHLAAGDLLRAEVEGKTPVGRQVAELMQHGELVPDEIIIRLLLPRIVRAAAECGFVLDGFPRTIEQAEEARRLVAHTPLAPNAVLYLDVPRDELVRRILARAEIEGRIDDNEETVHNRLRVFDEATRPLIQYYRKRDLLQVIDANRSADAVTDSVLTALDRAAS